MKRIPTSEGPYTIRLYYEDDEIEEICSNALAETGYLPSCPQPIKIDRFIEKKFNIKQIICKRLPPGYLGYTLFGSTGVEQVYITDPPENELYLQEYRRINATLAHEAGHGLLHTELYVGRFVRETLKDHPHVKRDRILCRTEHQVTQPKNRYSGEWWEFQANRAIGALLMPRQLFLQFMEPYLKQTGTPTIDQLSSKVQREAIKKAAEVFDVNERVARIRIEQESQIPF